MVLVIIFNTIGRSNGNENTEISIHSHSPALRQRSLQPSALKQRASGCAAFVVSRPVVRGPTQPSMT